MSGKKLHPKESLKYVLKVTAVMLLCALISNNLHGFFKSFIILLTCTPTFMPGYSNMLKTAILTGGAAFVAVSAISLIFAPMYIAESFKSLIIGIILFLAVKPVTRYIPSDKISALNAVFVAYIVLACYSQ